MTTKTIGHGVKDIAVIIACGLCFPVLAALALTVVFPVRWLRDRLARRTRKARKPLQLTRKQRRQWRAFQRENHELAHLGGLFATKAER